MAVPEILRVTMKAPASEISVWEAPKAGTVITVEGAGFDEKTEIRVEGIPAAARLERVGNATSSEIACRLPTVAQLQESPRYQRNALVMHLTLRAVTSNGEPSHAYVVPVSLPPPSARGIVLQHASRSAKNAETVDLLLGDPRGEGASLAHHGAPGKRGAGSEIRFYREDPAERLEKAVDVARFPEGHGAASLDARSAKILVEIRESGRLVEHVEWSEHHVRLILPRDTPGYLILWRDDLPTAGILFTPPVDCMAVENALLQSFRLAVDPNSGQKPPLVKASSLPTVSFVASAIPWSSLNLPPLVEQALAAANVKVHIEVKGVDASRVKSNGMGPDPSNPLAFPLNLSNGSATPSFTFMPQLYSARHAAPPPEVVTVELHAACTTGVCDSDVRVGLIEFQLEPLPIPTVAVLFTDVNFQGNVLVMMPGDSPRAPDGFQYILPQPPLHKRWTDEDDSASPTQVIPTISDPLRNLQFTLNLLGLFFPGQLPGADQVDLLTTLATQLDGADHPVVDTNGGVDDFEDAVNVDDDSLFGTDTDFDDAASSLILLGHPSFGAFVGYTDDEFDDDRYVFRVPEGALVAAVPDFRSPRATFGAVPSAFALDNAHVRDFNDALESARFE